VVPVRHSAILTNPPPLLGVSRVLFGIFMAVFAMSFRFLPFPICASAKAQPSKIIFSLFVNNRVKGKIAGNPPGNGSTANAVSVGKITKLVLNPVNSHTDGVSAVSQVIFTRYPAAIFGRVIALVVDAVDLISRRSWPHIRFKRLVRRHPLFAYRDASPAVIMKGRVCRVVASLLHIRPNSKIDGQCFVGHRFNSVAEGSV